MNQKIKLIILASVIALLALACVLLLNDRVGDNDNTDPSATNQNYDVLRLSADDIVRIDIENGENFYFERNSDGLWTSEGCEADELSQNNIDTLVSDLSVIVSVIKKEDDKTNESYGLNNPRAKFAITCKNGEKYDFTVGYKSPTVGDYFIVKNGDENIYTIYNYKVETLMQPRETYNNLTPLTIDFQNISKLNIKRNSRKELEIISNAKKDAVDVDSFTVWRLTKPYQNVYNAVDTKIELSLLVPLSEIKYEKYIKDTDYAKYGIDADSQTITISYDDAPEQVMQLGKTDNGKIYVKTNTSPYIYVAPEKTFDFINANEYDLVTKMPLLVYVNNVNQVSINTDGKNYVLDINHIDEDTIKYTFNGKEVPDEEKIYQAIISLSSDEEYAGQPLGEKVAAIKFRGITSDKDVNIELIDLDARNYAISYNSHIEFIMKKTKFASLVQSFDKFLAK